LHTSAEEATMKPETFFLAEMTNAEIELFLRDHDTVLIPTGSTEQHGPHSPVSTDILIPTELARRVAANVGAVIAPPVSYGLSYPHRGFTSVFDLTIDTFINVIADLCRCFARAGFRRIVFLNGHYDNTFAIAYGCAKAADDLPEGTHAFPLNYWEGFPPERAAQYIGPDKGMHANEGEVSAVLAINPDLVDMEQANAEFPRFPPTKTGSGAVHTAFFLTAPGSLWRITRTGTWGDATAATREKGEKFLRWGAEAVTDLLEDIDVTFKQLPIR
jgi:creatinine amidohydrolase